MNALYWTIYFIGVVLFPIAVGMAMGGGKKFNVFDEGIPVFLLSFVWPFVLAILICGGVLMGIFALVGFLWTFLLELGSQLSKTLERSPKKMEKAEREHEERVKNAKPGDKEYFDYVCD